MEKNLSKLLGIPYDPYVYRNIAYYNGEYGPLKEPLHMRPCPCCGGMPALTLQALYSFWGWFVKCKDCGIRTMYEAIDKPSLKPSGADKIPRVDESTRYTSAQAAEIAISKWNRRTAAANLRASKRRPCGRLAVAITDDIRPDNPSGRSAESVSN